MCKTFSTILFCLIVVLNSYSQEPIEFYQNETKDKIKNNKNNFLIASDSLVLYNNGTFKKFDKTVLYDSNKIIGVIDNDKITGTWIKNNNELILKPLILTRSSLASEKDISSQDNIILLIKDESLLVYKKPKKRTIKRLKRILISNQ